MTRILLAVLACTVALAVPGRAAGDAVPAVPLYTDQSLPAPVLRRLVEGQDLAMNMHYAEAAIRAAMADAPEHPLGQVFLMATLLGRLQESFRGGDREVPQQFFAEVDKLITMGEAQLKAHPESAYPRLYLGAGYGVRGLAKLYSGSYVSSYFDGKHGAAVLKEAVSIDPQLYDAYMGLGQFEYYCGTLGAVLQFVLALPGDPAKGLQMLQTCGDKGTYAAWPCKASLRACSTLSQSSGLMSRSLASLISSP